MTLFSSVCASPTRLRLAHNSGLRFDVHNEEGGFHDRAGWFANKPTLIAAHELGLPYSATTLCGAVRSGDVAKVMWPCTEQHCALDYPDDDIGYYAGQSGSIAMLEWLKHHGVVLGKGTSDGAASGGHLSALQYLHAEGCAMGFWVCWAAADRGDLVILKWAWEHDCKGDVAEVCYAAAASESGNIELMTWLLQQPGVQLTAGVMSSAASGGNLGMCEFLLANQCPWDEASCEMAARCGHLHILRWLREHDCPLQQQGVVFTAAQLTEMLNIAGVGGSL
jgi:hypothetical protein